MKDWHIVTPEYPNDPGGVSDYCAIMAAGLAARGFPVRVWCPASSRIEQNQPGVTVTPALGRFRLADLRHTGRLLNRCPGPRHLFVQWVPHGYGWKSMNLPFCVWLWKRARWDGDAVSLMVHEPCLAFREGSWRQDVAAAVHRVMLIFLLRASSRICITVPGWASFLQPWRFGAGRPLEWLPIFSNIAVHANSSAVDRYREFFPPGSIVAGHLGTYSELLRPLLDGIVAPLLERQTNLYVLLLGMHSDSYCEDWRRRHPSLAARVCSTGKLDEAELSAALQACDIALQPYPDGISSRRGSALAPLRHGLPVVSTRGYLTEPLWDEAEAVLMAPAANPSAFVQETLRLIHDTNLRTSLSKRSLTFYQKHFATEVILEQVVHDLDVPQY